MSTRTMVWAIVITFGFVAAEAIAGFLANSLALISDAGHNLADGLSLILSGYALWVAKKPSNARKTFGYHRAGILVALVNAVSLVFIAGLIGYEAIDRLRHPHTVHAGPMIWVALVAVVVNCVVAWMLRSGAKDDINIRSSYIHMVVDAAASVGVVIAGIVVWLTGATIADPIASLVIVALILWSSWGLMTESVDVLLEAAPAGIDTGAVDRTICAVPGVLGSHDLHVWTVGPGVIACSCHVVVAEQSIREGQQVLKAIVRALAQEYKINHTTIQVEVEGCEPDALYCTVHPHEHVGHTHT